jgi:hypothetical protein
MHDDKSCSSVCPETRKMKRKNIFNNFFWQKKSHIFNWKKENKIHRKTQPGFQEHNQNPELGGEGAGIGRDEEWDEGMYRDIERGSESLQRGHVIEGMVQLLADGLILQLLSI